MIIAILAGGNSTRMGTDKAAIILNGSTLLESVCGAAKSTGLDVTVIGRTPQEIPFADKAGIRFIPDNLPGAGPLPALLTALEANEPAEDVLLCPCDLPYIRTESIQWLVTKWQAALAESTADSLMGLVATSSGQDQPLFAVYSSSSIPLVRDLLTHGKRAMHDLLGAGYFLRVEIPTEHLAAITDVDTPDDLRRVAGTHLVDC